MRDRIMQHLNAAFEGAKDYKPSKKDWLASHWSGFMSPAQVCVCGGGGVTCIKFTK